MRERAVEEVAQLGKIRRKLEKFVRITQGEFDKLVDFTDPEKASVIPRGDKVPERRKKVVMTLQTVWTKTVQDDREFSYDDDDFDEILEIIRRLVKTSEDTYSDSEDTFRMLLLEDSQIDCSMFQFADIQHRFGWCKKNKVKR